MGKHLLCMLLTPDAVDLVTGDLSGHVPHSLSDGCFQDLTELVDVHTKLVHVSVLWHHLEDH